MSELIFSLEATVPIFLIMILGKILKKTNFITDGFTNIADKFVFKVALPVMLFEQVATTDIYQDFDLKFMLFCMITTTVMFAVCWILGAIFLKDKGEIGAFAQAAARGSAAILGMAFIENIYGSSGLGPLMIISSVPLFNIYSVIILVFNSKDRTKGKGAIKKSLFGVLTNPIIIGILLGLCICVPKLTIPTILHKAIKYIGVTATPLALITIGASFDVKKLGGRIKPIIFASVLKILIIPAAAIFAAVMMGFRTQALIAILIMTGAPTTVSSYIMAKNMGNETPLTASVIVVTTALSAFSITLFIFVLRNMGFI